MTNRRKKGKDGGKGREGEGRGEEIFKILNFRGTSPSMRICLKSKPDTLATRSKKASSETSRQKGAL